MLGRLALAGADAAREIGRPPADRLRHRLAAFEQQEMPGGQFLDPGDDAGVVGDIAEGEIILDRRQVRIAPPPRVVETSLDFGREGDRPVRQPDTMKTSQDWNSAVEGKR